MRKLLSVRTKAVIVMSALILLASAMLTYYFIESEKRIIFGNLERQGIALVNNIAYNSEYGLLTENEGILEDLLEGVMQQPDVVYCSISATKDDLLVEASNGSFPSAGIEPKARGAGKIIGRVTVRTCSREGCDAYVFTRPITSQVRSVPKGEAGILLVEEEWEWPEDAQTASKDSLYSNETGRLSVQKIGTAKVALSVKRAIAYIKNTRETALRIAGLFVLGFAIVVLVITKVALIPIHQLVFATRKIAQGDLDARVKIRSRDEIGELADAFNKMSEDLKSSTVSIEVLQAEQKRFEDIAKSSGDWVWEVDKEGKYIYTSPVAEQILGYRKEDLSGKHFYDLIVPEEREETKKAMFELFRQKTAFKSQEHQLIRKDGKLITLEVTALPVLDASAELTGYRGVSRDITERKKVEISQRLAKLGSMVSDMAHEVNNPLQIVSGRAQLAMMESPENEEIVHDLKIIQDQCARAKDIIQRMLKFSRPSKGLFEPGDINATIGFVVHLLEHQFSLYNISIEKDYEEDLPKVNMDEKQMHEVFMNLLKNAADAMPEGGKISIRTFKGDKNVRVEVKDTGEGISEEDLKKIFDPFFTTKETGTGLGLSVCYGIIKNHEGALKFTSTQGEGTTAKIVLPAWTPPKEALRGE